MECWICPDCKTPIGEGYWFCPVCGRSRCYWDTSAYITETKPIDSETVFIDSETTFISFETPSEDILLEAVIKGMKDVEEGKILSYEEVFGESQICPTLHKKRILKD